MSFKEVYPIQVEKLTNINDPYEPPFTKVTSVLSVFIKYIIYSF
ncbi:hypothetical protein RJD24_00805 [Bacillaceae bacterium IKA-2]|nr:hypothetical protein RJD24_00805 [Bacillaceae bacterium IKA-2]